MRTQNKTIPQLQWLFQPHRFVVKPLRLDKTGLVPDTWASISIRQKHKCGLKKTAADWRKRVSLLYSGGWIFSEAVKNACEQKDARWCTFFSSSHTHSGRLGCEAAARWTLHIHLCAPLLGFKVAPDGREEKEKSLAAASDRVVLHSRLLKLQLAVSSTWSHVTPDLTAASLTDWRQCVEDCLWAVLCFICIMQRFHCLNTLVIRSKCVRKHLSVG